MTEQVGVSKMETAFFEEEREAFEKVQKESGATNWDLTFRNGTYQRPHTSLKFEGWISRAKLEKERFV